MKIILPVILLLAACASVPISEDAKPPEPAIPEAVEEPAPSPKRVTRKIKPAKKAAEATTPEPNLLPCPVDTDNPKEEIITKLDCLLEIK